MSAHSRLEKHVRDLKELERFASNKKKKGNVVYNHSQNNIWITTVDCVTRVRTDALITPGQGIDLDIMGLKKGKPTK